MEFVHAYKSVIDALVAWAGTAEILHIHFGLAIYLGTLLVVRDRRGTMIALYVVALAEFCNEVIDWLGASPRWTVEDTVSDIVLSLMWPIAITLVLRYRRLRWQRTLVTAQAPRLSSSATTGTSIASL